MLLAGPARSRACELPAELTEALERDAQILGARVLTGLPCCEQGFLTLTEQRDVRGDFLISERRGSLNRAARIIDKTRQNVTPAVLGTGQPGHKLAAGRDVGRGNL